MSFTYEYARPAVTADCVVLRAGPHGDEVLLIRRLHDPFAGSWALPGGFVDAGETLEQAARRELLEETRLHVGELRQLWTVGTPGRDPRGWTVSVVFVGRVDAAAEALAGDDAGEVGWFGLADLPALAFDHAEVLARL